VIENIVAAGERSEKSATAPSRPDGAWDRLALRRQGLTSGVVSLSIQLDQKIKQVHPDYIRAVKIGYWDFLREGYP
jgi:hypothetical protein